MVALDLVHHLVHHGGAEPHRLQRRREPRLVPVAVRAAVELVPDRRGADDAHARVGRVVDPLALLPVVVPDVVRVALVELLARLAAARELLPPQRERVLERDADALEEEAELHPPVVLEVVGGAEPVVERAHAQRGRARHGRGHRVQRQPADGDAGGAGGGEVGAEVRVGEVLEQRAQALRLLLGLRVESPACDQVEHTIVNVGGLRCGIYAILS